MEEILSFFNNPAITAIIGFLSGLVAQFLLRYQISKHEIRKEKIQYRKLQLERLKGYGEQMISQIKAYDDLANHIVVTLNNGMHDEKRLENLSQKIKKLNEEIEPKLQIHFYDLADCQNSYSMAVRAFQDSFFQGIKYEGLKQRGWKAEDLERINEEIKEVSEQKYKLIAETIKYLNEKEDSLYDS